MGRSMSAASRLERGEEAHDSAHYGDSGNRLSTARPGCLDAGPKLDHSEDVADSHSSENTPCRCAAVGPAEGLAKDLKLKEVVLGLDSYATAPLAAYGIDKEKFEKENQIVVLVYNRHKVERRVTFDKDKALTEAGVNEILAAADKM